MDVYYLGYLVGLVGTAGGGVTLVEMATPPPLQKKQRMCPQARLAPIAHVRSKSPPIAI